MRSTYNQQRWYGPVMNVGDLVWLPERLRTGPIPSLCADLCASPGRLVSITADWAMVRYPRWGEFGCGVEELTAYEPEAAQ